MKKNLILIVVLLVIGLFYFWDTKRIEKQEVAEEKAAKVFVHSKDNIGEITIDKGIETIAAKKEGDNWVLTSPLKADGDKPSWDSISRTLADAKKDRTIESATDSFALYGLDQPEMRVTIADVGGASPETIRFGKQTALGSTMYAMVDGASEEVFTVNNSVKTAADKSLFDLRDKTILAVETPDVQRVDVTIGGSSYQVQRSGDAWRVTNPYLARADKSKVEGAINKIRNGKIKSFVDEKPDDLAEYGLIEPATRIVFWVGDAGAESQWSSKALLLGATSDISEQSYAKREGQETVFSVESSILSDVPESPEDLRMRKVTDVRSWDVDHFTLARAGEIVFEASKDGVNWMLVQPEEGEVEYSAISDTLRAIADLEIHDFVTDTTDEVALGIDKPEIVFSLTTDKGIEEIALSAPQERNALEVCYGVREDPRELYAILIDDASAVFEKAADVKMKEPEPEEEGEI
ncbi:MAG: DUF4340 domain-containing protein [bacterium]